MAFGERIKVTLDLDGNFGSKLRGIRSSVADADGFLGKFKAGAKGSFDAVKGYAGELAVAGGAALVGFGIKAVHAFEDTAKAAIDLGDATGLSTEAASRWIGVADDYKVSAEELTTGIGKIAKTLDDEKWSKYGIATRDAAGNARDANDILLDTFAMLSKVKNGTEQARIGNELFGKGYANLAPIIGHTRSEYEKMLGSVEDGQVITRQEAERAERMRLAEDKLRDALQEVTLAFGQWVAGLAPAVSGLVDVIEKVDELAEKAGLADGVFQSLTPSSDNVGKTSDFARKMAELALATDDATGYLVEHGLSAGAAEKLLASYRKEQEEAIAKTNVASDAYEHAGIEMQDLGSDAGAAADVIKSRLNRELINLKIAADNAGVSFEEMRAKLNDEESWDQTEGNIADLKVALWEALDAGARGAEDATEKLETYTDQLRTTKQGVIDYGEQIGLLPTQVQTLLTLADNGQIEEMERRLAILTRNRTMNVSIVAKGGVGYGPGITGPFHDGGVVPGPAGSEQLALVKAGEHVMTPGQVESLARSAPAGGNGQGSGGVTNVYVQTGADPNSVIRIIKQAQKRGEL